MAERTSSTVLMTTPSLDQKVNVSGVGTVVRGILEGCAHSPWRFQTVIIGKSDRQSRGLGWALGQLLAPLRFVFAILRGRPEIIHVHGPLNYYAVPRDLFLLFLAKLFTAHLVYHLHGGAYVSSRPKSPLMHKLIVSLLKLPDAILVLGAREAESIVDLYEADAAHVTVLPNAVPIPAAPAQRARSGALRVVSIGRLSPEKGLDVLCDAVEQDKRLRQTIHLKMFGAGPREATLVPRLADALGTKFEFGGVIGPSVRDEVLRWADILIMPSLHGEGLPMVLLEAMAAGVVPIATDDGMILDVLRPDETGFLIAKGSGLSIAKSMHTAMAARNEGQLEHMSRAARELIVKNHSLQAYTSALDQFYSGLYELA